MANLLVLNGPNLNLLGNREPGIYGTTTLDSINKQLQDSAKQQGHSLSCFQSNSESELIERIHSASDSGSRVDFIILNPAAFTHTSIALRDALSASGIPFIEIHISNIFAREDFRSRSYFSDIAIGTITGLGISGYQLALTAAIEHLA